MDTEKTLQARSESRCELCGAAESLGVYEVPPGSNGSANNSCFSAQPAAHSLKIRNRLTYITGVA